MYCTHWVSDFIKNFHGVCDAYIAGPSNPPALPPPLAPATPGTQHPRTRWVGAPAPPRTRWVRVPAGFRVSIAPSKPAGYMYPLGQCTTPAGSWNQCEVTTQRAGNTGFGGVLGPWRQIHLSRRQGEKIHTFRIAQGLSKSKNKPPEPKGAIDATS